MRAARVWPSSSGFNSPGLAPQVVHRRGAMNVRHRNGDLPRDRWFSMGPTAQSDMADASRWSQIRSTYELKMGVPDSPNI